MFFQTSRLLINEWRSAVVFCSVSLRKVSTRVVPDLPRGTVPCFGWHKIFLFAGDVLSP